MGLEKKHFSEEGPTKKEDYSNQKKMHGYFTLQELNVFYKKNEDLYRSNYFM